MNFRRLALFALFAGSTGISTIQATQISNSYSGLSNPAFIQTFENPSFTQNSLINTAFAQLSSTALFYDGNAGGGNCAFFEEGGNCVTNFTSVVGNGTPASTQPTFSIFFTTVQTGAAFALVTGSHTDNDTFTALLKGIQVAQFTVLVQSNYTPSDFGNYFGFSGIAGGFDQIQVQTTGSNLALIDNVQLSTANSIPEPGTLALLGMGLVGFAAFRRRFA